MIFNQFICNIVPLFLIIKAFQYKNDAALKTLFCYLYNVIHMNKYM